MHAANPLGEGWTDVECYGLGWGGGRLDLLYRDYRPTFINFALHRSGPSFSVIPQFLLFIS
jgi:hypothetical protein